MIIDIYTAHAATTNTGVISLFAGQYYSIKLQLEELTGYAKGRRDRGVREERGLNSFLISDWLRSVSRGLLEDANQRKSFLKASSTPQHSMQITPCFII